MDACLNLVGIRSLEASTSEEIREEDENNSWGLKCKSKSKFIACSASTLTTSASIVNDAPGTGPTEKTDVASEKELTAPSRTIDEIGEVPADKLALAREQKAFGISHKLNSGIVKSVVNLVDNAVVAPISTQIKKNDAVSIGPLTRFRWEYRVLVKT
ncbi:unnamed protein product [Notodromas monacha]|uniref:Uncharacterized protein n=1 Tax=Notodromas monacha TaxID=399045 RepID=A0A7R9BTB6_9CRUS|nr:unnamed protein product [Notodromas monacha]CAG0921369.1 unnamed protein product [Notodromas monacha]